jgi:hypothetical protein
LSKSDELKNKRGNLFIGRGDIKFRQDLKLSLKNYFRME